MAARQMRRILVESARSKRRRKRGAGAAKVTLDEALINGILQPPAYGREPAASRTPTRPVSATAAAPPENKVWRWTLNAVRKMRVGADADGQVQTLGGFPNPMATTEVSEGTFISVETVNPSIPYVAATQTISQPSGVYYSMGAAIKAALDAFDLTLRFPEAPGVHWSALARSRLIHFTQTQFRNAFGSDPVHATYTFTLVGQAAP